MATLTDFVRVLTEEGGAAHAGRPLPMEPWVYGAIAVAVMILLLGLTWMFRHTAQVMIEGDNRPHGHGPAHTAPADGTSGGGHH